MSRPVDTAFSTRSRVPRPFTRRIHNCRRLCFEMHQKFTTGTADKLPVATRTTPILMMLEIQREAGFRDFDGAKF